METWTPHSPMDSQLTYEDAVAFLYGRINFERTQSRGLSKRVFKLDRMQALLERLDNPQARIPAIHVAGTKGKGSTSAMLAAILEAAGYRVGLFTSPHVSTFEERFTVAGQTANAETVVKLVQTVEPHVAAMSRENPVMRPTFFEIITAIGWLHFLAAQVDIVVLEVGLGGRLDSTNVCRPIVSVITNISFDHMAILGDTLAKIAAEKAGIIKPSVPIVSGVVADEARTVIRAVARDNAARLWELDREIHCDYRLFAGIDSAGFDDADARRIHGCVNVETPLNRWDELEIGLVGRHQAINAALALGVVDTLNSTDGSRFQIPPTAPRAALRSVRWPLRIEIVRREPLVVLDAAHNEASMRALTETLAACFPGKRRVLLFGTTADKDVAAMLQIAISGFDEIVLTCYSNNPRALQLEELERLAGQLTDRRFPAASNSAAAWEYAVKRASPDILICAAGSFFFAAEMRELLMVEATSTATRLAIA
ncbi:MAG: bifunctional folylpolyglutamate synthase/dihydrofolate synthase [Planctomycetota bacterium]|nr:bifunctional folylpolyglutamate synthase/dihydrofolate synthase [Planctomycetota bacterium]